MALSKKIATGFIEIGVDDRRMDSDMARTKTKVNAGFAEIASQAASILGEIGVIAGIERFNMFGRQMAREAETARVSLGLLIGSAERGAKVFAELSKFSSEIPFSKDEVLKAARALHEASIPAEQFGKTLKFLGDIAAGSGKKLDEMVAIFAKIKDAGILTGEAFLELRKKSIDLGPALKRTLGVSNEELAKLLMNGQVTAEVVEKAFKNMTKGAGQFTGAMERVSKTSQGLRGELFAKFAEAMIKIGESVKPIIDAFMRLGIVALDTFMALPAPIQTVLGLMINLVPAIISVSVAFKVMKLAGLGSFKAIKTAAWALVASPLAPFVLIAGAIGLLLAGFIKLFTYLRSRGVALKRFAEAWDKVKRAFRVVGDAIMAVISQILMSFGILSHALKIDDWQRWLDFAIFAVAEVANMFADFVLQVGLWVATFIEHWDLAFKFLKLGFEAAFLAMGDVVHSFIGRMMDDFRVMNQGIVSSMKLAAISMAQAIGGQFAAAAATAQTAQRVMDDAINKRNNDPFKFEFSDVTKKALAAATAEFAKLKKLKEDLENKQDQDDEVDEKGEPGEPRPKPKLRSRSSAFVGLAAFATELQNIANQDEQNGIPAQHLRATQRSIEIQRRQAKVQEDILEQMKNQNPRPPVAEFPL